jgi:hypothetical protein
MTKQEILNGMSEQEFYSMYPTKEAWEQSQQEMAYGGSPFIQGFPFGAGITMADGGTPYYGGPTRPYAYGGGLQKYQGDKQGSQVTLTPQQVAAADQAFGRIDHYSIRGQDDENANTAYKAQIDSLYRNPKYDIVSKIDSLNKVYPTVNEGLEDVPFNTIFNPDKEYNKNLIYKKENISGASIPYMQKNEPQNLNKFENKANPYFKNSSYKEYGGYMEDGGNASPFNYGTFPAMNAGGDPNDLWLAQQQLALEKRTKQGVPSDVKPTGTNPLNFNPYIKGSDIAQPDSMHTSPYNPNIAAYFKGNKMIAGPAQNTGQAIQAARKVNTGKFYKKDNEIYPNYQQDGGGFINDGGYPMMNNGGIDYSSTINDVFSKYQKKSGGVTSQGGNQNLIKKQQADFYNAIQSNVINKFNQDERDIANQVTQQATQEVDQAYQGYAMGGGPGMSYGYNAYGAPNLDNQYNQEMLQAKLDSYNDQHALDRENMRGANQMLAANIDQNLAGQRASEQYWDSFGTPKAQSGGDWDAAWAQQEAEEARRTAAYSIEKKKAKEDYIESLRQKGKTAKNTQQATTQNSYGDINWKQFAQEFGPQGRVNGLNYFPANMRQYYQMNKAGKKAFMDLPENFKTKGLEVERTYGPVARTWFGNKLGLGARKVNIKLSGESDWENTPYNQGPQVQLADPNNPLFKPYSQYNTGAPEGTLQTNKGSFAPLDFNLGVQKTMGYGGLYKAVEGVGTPISMGQGVALTGAPPATNFIGAPPAIDYKANAGIKDPEINKFTQRGEKGTNKLTAEAQLRRKWQGLGQTMGQYAVPGINMIASMFEQDDLENSEQALEQGMLADNAKVVRPANAFNMGTYNVNSGDFRENQKNSSQYPGFNAQFGGFNTMQNGGEQGDTWEDDLSEDEIENLRAQGYNIEYLD